MSNHVEDVEEEEEGEEDVIGENAKIAQNARQRGNSINAFAEAYEYLQQNNNQHNNTNKITMNRNMLVNETTRRHLANTSTPNNNIGSLPSRNETTTSSIGTTAAANAPPTYLNGLGLYFKDLFGTEIKLNGATRNTTVRDENGFTLNNFWPLSGVTPLMISDTLFPNVDLDALRKKNILDEFVVNNLRGLHFKLMEMHKRKMFVEEMILKLQKDKMDIDMQTMQLQNEKFLLLNTAMTAASIELPKHETTTESIALATNATTTTATVTPIQNADSQPSRMDTTSSSTSPSSSNGAMNTSATMTTTATMTTPPPPPELPHILCNKTHIKIIVNVVLMIIIPAK
ncbi:probable serine/threonine-protein kinase tsuA [Eurosta solidaginis]|uniref:probable serine/threonine-protein kinase tsuA n=1 Tax=Eurosta solidaginis TaxID=178769 RepID=UPI003530AED7